MTFFLLHSVYLQIFTHDLIMYVTLITLRSILNEKYKNVHVCTRKKLNIIHCCQECSHQVLHEAHIPSQDRSDQAHILLQTMQQC